MFAVVREQARIEFVVRGRTHRASTQRGVDLQRAQGFGGLTGCQGTFNAIHVTQHMHHTFALFQGRGQAITQGLLVTRVHIQAEHRQLDGVFFETIDAWKARGGQEVTVHPQVGVTTWARPIGQLGVHALAVEHEGRQQANVLPFELLHELRRNALRRLRGHRGTIMDAVLGAELHIEQAQEVPHLGGGAHGGFAPTTREALLNGHCRWNAIHRIHLRTTRGLHDAAGIGIQTLEITTLTFVEQNIKRQGRFA